MQLSKFEFTSISGRRYGRSGERNEMQKIETNSTIVTIDKVDEKTATVEFRFTVNYGPSGNITLEGRLFYEGEGDEGPDVLVEKWQSKGTMNRDLASAVHSAVVAHCLPEAVVIARDLRLRPPFPIPKIQIPQPSGGKDAKAGIGSSGFEVA